MKPGAGERRSTLDRLRDGPVLQSPAELSRAIDRLNEVQELAAGLPSLDRLPKSRITGLARFAGAAKAQAVERLPNERRIATLLAYIRTLEASAHDDVLDLFDVVVTDMFADAKAAGQKERLGSIRDLDAAALLLRQACAVLLDESTPDRAERLTVFETISRRGRSIAQCQLLTRAMQQDARPAFHAMATAEHREPCDSRRSFHGSGSARGCNSLGRHDIFSRTQQVSTRP